MATTYGDRVTQRHAVYAVLAVLGLGLLLYVLATRLADEVADGVAIDEAQTTDTPAGIVELGDVVIRGGLALRVGDRTSGFGLLCIHLDVTNRGEQTVDVGMVPALLAPNARLVEPVDPPDRAPDPPSAAIGPGSTARATRCWRGADRDGRHAILYRLGDEALAWAFEP